MDDYSETFQCKNGILVTIEIDDINHIVTVLSSDNREVGRIEFSEKEDGLKVIWMYLDHLGTEYIRQGIGRRCLQIIKERSGLPVLAEDDDGHREDDGSHLTGDAPAFVARMRMEGLIAPSTIEQEWLAYENLGEE